MLNLILPPETKAQRLRRMTIDLVLFIALASATTMFLIFAFDTQFYDTFPDTPENRFYTMMVDEAFMLIGVIMAAWIMCTIHEQPMSILGFSLKGRWRDWVAGFGFAAVVYAVGFGVSLLLGAIEVAEVVLNPLFLLESLLFFLMVSVAEELAVRGFILGRMLDAGINRFLALLLSSIIFALLHLFNPHLELIPFLNLVLAGLLLGASYLYTRNLCFPIALHWFWNWLQGPILGYEVSGNYFENGLVHLRLYEENLINGSPFGFEGSLVCTVLMLAGIALIIGHYERKNRK